MSQWVPKNMEWFLAEHIQQFTFANGDNPLVWVNTVLVQATSLEEAYSKAMAQGEHYNHKFINTDQVEVTCTFRGLRDLYLVYDKLEDGSEISWTEYDDLDNAQIAAMVTPKEKLAAFVAHGQKSAESRVEPGDQETEALDDALVDAKAMNRSAQAKRDKGDISGAVSLYEQSLLLIRKLDRPGELAYTLRHLADLHSELGQFQKAKREIEEAIAKYRDTPYGSPLDLANALRISALNAERQTTQLWREAEELYTSLKVQTGANEARLHIHHLSTLTATGEMQ